MVYILKRNHQSGLKVSIPSVTMSSGTFVDRIDPFAKRSMKKKTKKSQGSSRYRNSTDLELQQLPMFKGEFILCTFDMLREGHQEFYF